MPGFHPHMANPRSSSPPFITPATGSRRETSPFSDEALWRRLREAGFDEESIQRRDKAALIAYIAKLESEMFDYQHHMGLLLLERNEWTSKFEQQFKASAESAELMYKREKAAHLCTLADAKKQEDSLKKALRVEKECLLNVEKALHETRVEAAQTKVAAEIKLTESHNTMESANIKLSEAEQLLLDAQSLQAEVSRHRETTEIKLKEVEALEEDFKKRCADFDSDCVAKEKDIIIERQSLSERQRFLQQGEERLLNEKASLSKREEYIFSRSQEINRLGKELESSKANLEKDYTILNEEKLSFNLKVASLSTREEAIIEKEALLYRKEQDLHNLQEKCASQESKKCENLYAALEAKLNSKQSEFDAELQRKLKVAEDEIESKKRAWELKEVDLTHKEYTILERENDLEVHARALADKEKDLTEKSNDLLARQMIVSAAEKESSFQKEFLSKEQSVISNMKSELDQARASLEENRAELDLAKEKLNAKKIEANESMILELRLKEEIDAVRSEKQELIMEADKLGAEKKLFEAEWNSIDDKREQLRKEAEHVAESRRAVSMFLNQERDFLKQEKDLMHEQFEREIESFHAKKEAFVREMEQERSKWFSTIQKERADLLLEIEVRGRELENRFKKRHEELERSFKTKEREFEEERKMEAQNISSVKETIAKDREFVEFEMNRLNSERLMITRDRDLQEKEWSELGNSIQELKSQTLKLVEQRELLSGDRESISAQIEYLEKLENLKKISDNIEMQRSVFGSTGRKLYAKKSLRHKDVKQTLNLDSHRADGDSLPSMTRFSWVKRCADLVFKKSGERLSNRERSLLVDFEDSPGIIAGQLDLSAGYLNQKTEEGFQKGDTEIKKVENFKEITALDSKFKGDDSSESSAHSHSEEVLLEKRKRIRGPFSGNGVTTPSKKKKSHKKRRQEEVGSEEVTAQSYTQSKGVGNQSTTLHLYGSVTELVDCIPVADSNGYANSAPEENGVLISEQ